MKKVKTLWLGCNSRFSNLVFLFDSKPKDTDDDSEVDYFCRSEMLNIFRGTGVKLPRKNSKQLIPFHLVPAKVKKTVDKFR